MSSITDLLETAVKHLDCLTAGQHPFIKEALSELMKIESQNINEDLLSSPQTEIEALRALIAAIRAPLTEENRLKPKQKEWYEDIPEQGVLCWVSDVVEKPSRGDDLNLIMKKYEEFISISNISWLCATPLTDDEIRQFLRGESHE